MPSISIEKTNVIGLDFETYWDQHITLGKMSTTEYVRHPKFFVHTVSVKTSEGSWSAAYEDIPKLFDQFDWSKKALLCHHTHFDGLILSELYGKKPAYYLDTLSMARPLHGGDIKNSLGVLLDHYNLPNKLKMPDFKGIERIEEPLLSDVLKYNDRDVEGMWGLFWDHFLKWYDQDELDLIHYTVAAYCRPELMIDVDIGKSIIEEETKKRIDLLDKLNMGEQGQDIKTRAKPLRSRETFAKMLRALGVDPPIKLNKDGKPTYAFAKTDLDFMALEDHPDEEVRLLVETKQAMSSTIYISRPERLLLHTDNGKKPLPVYLAYGKAHTLRWAGGDKVNLQNTTHKTRMREMIIAPKKHKLVIGDSAQIEARKNAYLAGQDDLLAAFSNNEDIYSDFAANQIYNKPVEEISKMPERFVGKGAILGLGFQMGVAKFKYTLNSGSIQEQRIHLPSEDMYAKAVYGYRERFPKIVEQWAFMQSMLPVLAGYRDEDVEYGPVTFVKGAVVLPNGLYLTYPNLRPVLDDQDRVRSWLYKEKTKIYGGLLTENIVQCLARIVVAQQILATIREIDLPPKMLVHDEGAFCVPNKRVDEVTGVFLKHLNTPPSWCATLPTKGEVFISERYQKDEN